MEFLIIGIATAFNILIIKIKVEKRRYEDALFDGAILIALSMVFGGTYGGMVVATITSAIISVYFMASPPLFFSRLKVIDRIKAELNDLHI